jgi:hypothetical protein
MKREVERHRDRPYRSGRSADWIKVKNPEPRGEPDHGNNIRLHRDEFFCRRPHARQVAVPEAPLHGQIAPFGPTQLLQLAQENVAGCLYGWVLTGADQIAQAPRLQRESRLLGARQGHDRDGLRQKGDESLSPQRGHRHRVDDGSLNVFRGRFGLVGRSIFELD